MEFSFSMPRTIQARFGSKTQSSSPVPIPLTPGSFWIFSTSSLRIVTAEQGKTAPARSLGTSPDRWTVISAPISFRGTWAAWR